MFYRSREGRSGGLSGQGFVGVCPTCRSISLVGVIVVELINLPFPELINLPLRIDKHACPPGAEPALHVPPELELRAAVGEPVQWRQVSPASKAIFLCATLGIHVRHWVYTCVTRGIYVYVVLHMYMYVALYMFLRVPPDLELRATVGEPVQWRQVSLLLLHCFSPA